MAEEITPAPPEAPETAIQRIEAQAEAAIAAVKDQAAAAPSALEAEVDKSMEWITRNVSAAIPTTAHNAIFGEMQSLKARLKAL